MDLWLVQVVSQRLFETPQDMLALIPATFRMLRPVIFLAAVAIAVAALFPNVSCQVAWVAQNAPFCGR